VDYDKDILGLDTKVRFAGDCDDTREIRFALIYREGSLSMDKEIVNKGSGEYELCLKYDGRR